MYHQKKRLLTSTFCIIRKSVYSHRRFVIMLHIWSFSRRLHEQVKNVEFLFTIPYLFMYHRFVLYSCILKRVYSHRRLCRGGGRPVWGGCLPAHIWGKEIVFIYINNISIYLLKYYLCKLLILQMWKGNKYHSIKYYLYELMISNYKSEGNKYYLFKYYLSKFFILLIWRKWILFISILFICIFYIKYLKEVKKK